MFKFTVMILGVLLATYSDKTLTEKRAKYNDLLQAEVDTHAAEDIIPRVKSSAVTSVNL